jgi:hypothetical protein
MRAEVVLEILGRMAEDDDGEYLADVHGRLVDCWRSRLPPAEAVLPPPLAELIDEFWTLLTVEADTSALRYTTFDRAVLLADRLSSSVIDGTTHSDLLNALWWSWLCTHEEDPCAQPVGREASRLERQARERAEEMMALA